MDATPWYPRLHEGGAPSQPAVAGTMTSQNPARAAPGAAAGPGASSAGAPGSTMQPAKAGTGGQSAGDPAQPGNGGCATFDGAFPAIQKVIFEGHGCTAKACHGEAKSGGMDLRPDVAYANLVDAQASNSVHARVQPGSATESFLYEKLEAATNPGSVQIAGSPMPVGAAPLSKDELAAIQLWIKKGAPEHS